MTFAGVFASLASGFSDQFGGPFEAASIWRAGTATYDSGGSITAAGTPSTEDCRIQFDTVTQAMRADPGFLQTDVRMIVLAHDLATPLDTKARIVVSSGANAGTWELQSATLDPVGIGWECRARRI